MMSNPALHISHNLEHFIRSSCEGNQVTPQLKRTSLAQAKTERIVRCNKQRRMNGLVEIVVAEVARLQLYRLKTHISCG